MDKELDTKKEESFIWISKVIETCTNSFHFQAIDNLIDLHFHIYADEEIKTELQLLKVRKWNEIHVTLS